MIFLCPPPQNLTDAQREAVGKCCWGEIKAFMQLLAIIAIIASMFLCNRYIERRDAARAAQRPDVL